MTEEKPNRTYQEWQAIVGKMDAKTFEELSYQILTRMGFEKLNYRGGSADGGRDIEGEKTRLEPDGINKFTEKYRFECKCFADGTIPWPKISDKIHSAHNAKIDKFVIISNQGLAPHAQDEIEKFQSTSPMKVITWGGFNFLNILFRYPDLCEYYFPDERIPTIAANLKPKHIFKAVLQVGNNFGVEFETALKEPIALTEDNIKKLIADALRSIFAKNLAVSDKDKAIIYSNIAMIFCQFEYYEDALSFIDKAVEIDKAHVFLDNKGYILEKMHRIKESNDCYKKSLRANPKNPIALNNLAHNLRRQGKFEDALKTIEEAITLSPSYLTAINNKANILRDLRKFDEALNFLNTKIPEDSSLTLQKTKIQVLIDAFDLKEAHRLNERMLELNPNDADSMNNKGVIYEHNAKFQNAEKYLKLAFECFAKARELNPKFALAISNQVVCFLDAGNLAEGETLTNAGLAIEPKNSYLLNNKAKIELHKGNFQSALEYVDAALKMNQSEQFLLTKINILMQLKRHKEAEKFCKTVLSIDENNSDAMFAMSQIYHIKRLPKISKHWLTRANGAKRKPLSLLE